MDRSIVFVIGALIVAIIIIVLIKKHFKSLKIPCVYLITGSPKTGKSAVSVFIIITRWLKNVVRWCFRWPFLKIFRRKIPPMPLIYTNIPLVIRHQPLTLDIVKMEVRIPEKSVVLIDEASLFADSLLYKDDEINKALVKFNKLFGHFSHGGTLVYNSQNITDLHFSIKRSAGRYLYIYDTQKYPFISVSTCREMVYSEDNGAVNNMGQDIELSMRKIFFSNFIYKFYDCFCYSCFTDGLAYKNDNIQKFNRKRDLKAHTIISFNEYFSNLGGSKEDEKNNDK